MARNGLNGCWLLALGWLLAGRLLVSGQVGSAATNEVNFEALRLAINDLIATFGTGYPQGDACLARLAALEAQAISKTNSVQEAFRQLQRDALLANPLLQSNRLLVVKRRPAARAGTEPGLDIGLPSNHECNSSLVRTGYDNQIAVLSPIGPQGTLQTLFRPDNGGYVGEVDLHWKADRLLFTLSDATNWKLFEIRPDGSGLRQVSAMPDDVDSFDGCYLPDGNILFGSTASYQSVPCWHGQKRVSNLYLMRPDGTGVRQVCFDQDHDFHPVVIPNGQVLYHRWDYTGINHVFLRELMLMNPDGTGQHAIYGSSSWYPNALYFPRPVPGDGNKILCILSGYHGVHRMGQLVILDLARGWQEADGIAQRLSGRGTPIQPRVKDDLVSEDWPKFLHPVPLSDKYFLVAAWPNPKANWGIYLVDVFDNLVLLREEPGYALLEPVLLRSLPQPPVLPSRVDPARQDGLVYLHDVYAGPGLKGVPRGTIQKLRVLAYHFAYRGLGGPDRIGYGGPWEAMRILGTVPIEPDGSALFRVPANTPIAVQPLDAEGKAVQLMRSWFTVMPGEVTSCVGCHERPADVPKPQLAAAAQRAPQDLVPWFGPARGFDFEREVQPVLDRYCVECHGGATTAEVALPDLRSARVKTNYTGRPISPLGTRRLHPQMLADTHGVLRYAPAYDALIPYLRRVGIEDDVSLLIPGEYYVDTSPLIQLVRQGHHGVTLDAESWDRLITWIDLNAPCHGTWGEVYPIPDQAHERRMALRRQFGGAREDPEVVPECPPPKPPVKARTISKAAPVSAPDWAFDAQEARRRQAALGQTELTLNLGGGITLKLARIPPGEFVMGATSGQPDQVLPNRVTIPKAFWMGTCEVTTAQYRRFDASHDARYYGKRHAREEDQGLPLNEPEQPVVRVSWNEAMAFCGWLSQLSGRQVTLPTESQWEYACRAGTDTPFFFGGLEVDFSPWANFADRSFSHGLLPNGTQSSGGILHLVLEGADLADRRFDDHAVVTLPVGRLQANPWGLFDMHGNAAEWTRSISLHAEQHPGSQSGLSRTTGRRVVRGGSFFDPPSRCGSSARLDYPEWQRVFNVGFRVVCEE